MLAETVGSSTARAGLQAVELHLALVEPEQVPGARVAHVERDRARPSGARPDEEGVLPAGAVDARLRRAHVDPARGAVAGPTHACRTPTGTTPQAPGQEPVRPAVQDEDRRALEDVEALLERVQVLVHRAVGRRACTGRRPCAPTRRPRPRASSGRSRCSHPGTRAAGGSRRRAGRGALFSTTIQSRRRRRQLRPRGRVFNPPELERAPGDHRRGNVRDRQSRRRAASPPAESRSSITGRDAGRAAAVAARDRRGVRGLALDLAQPAGIASQLADVGQVDSLVIAAIERDENTVRDYDVERRPCGSRP